ncbi:MAG: CPBP family intramembrane metalloprotease [Chloroflexus sp.]|nr:CPBP family intramembrane metalloprotease [Chloroflexus sp.]
MAPIWYLAAIGGPVVIALTALVVTTWLRLPRDLPVPQGGRFALVNAALISSLLTNPWEEVGWRGFALPHWQQRYYALAATLIVGILWILWHLPIFFWIGKPMSIYPFSWLAGTIAGAVVYTWLYNSTAGSLLPVTLFHVAFNTAVVVIGGISITALAMVQILGALAIVMAFGPAHLARRERVGWMG